MSTKTIAGLFLIATPIWFTVWFSLLGARFDYPAILRRPPDEVLSRFRDGGTSLILMWWAFALSGGLLIVIAVLLARLFDRVAPTLALMALVAGVLAGLVQVLGLLRWVYLVPALARWHGDPDADHATKAATIVAYRAFHHYLGVGVGEHLGYALTGAWTILVGLAVLQSQVLAAWLAWVAIVIGAALVVCSLEFLGPNEERGWRLAGKAVPVVYVAWSLWLFALGVSLVV